jgi:hypothetical protein
MHHFDAAQNRPAAWTQPSRRNPDESPVTRHGLTGSASMMHLCLAGYPGE